MGRVSVRQHTGLNLSSMPGRRHRASAGPMRRERRALRAIGALLALPAASADLRVIPEGYCAAPTIKQAAWVKRGEEFDGTMFAFGPFLTGETRDDGMAKGKCFIRTEAWQNYEECKTYCAGAFAEPMTPMCIDSAEKFDFLNEEHFHDGYFGRDLDGGGGR